MSLINKCFVLNIHSVDMTMRAHIYTEKREIVYLSFKPILRYLLNTVNHNQMFQSLKLPFLSYFSSKNIVYKQILMPK